ncbi:MAG: efflux RND transporter periplasmic adaptor subunit [Steroidobacteraceae bacterium]
MSRRAVLSAALACTAAGALAACSSHHQAHPRASAPALAAVRVGFERGAAEQRFDGIVQAVDRATLTAQTAGRVIAVYHHVDDSVPAGALLMRLHATIQRAGLGQARAALRAAAARATEVQRRYRRIRQLYDQQVVPKADLDQVTAARDAAVAELNSARAAVASATQGVDYTEIRAPYAGVITRRMVQVGEAVAPGTALLGLASLHALRVVVSIPQSLTARVRRMGAATIYLGRQPIRASHVTVFPEASPRSNTFTVHLGLPAGLKGLFPGMVVRVGFDTGERAQILVPQSAVVRRSAVTSVYLVQPDGQTLLQQVRLGEPVGAQVEVLAGLEPGEQVALNPLAAMRRLAPFPVITGSAQ